MTSTTGIHSAAPAAVGDRVRIFHRSVNGATGERSRTRQPGEYLIVRENRHRDWTVRDPRTGCVHDVLRGDVELVAAG